VAPKRTWLQEERRRTLGDWVAFCPSCGHAQRYFEDYEADLPGSCPTCGADLVSRCAQCNAMIPSVFAVECEDCGAALRDPEGFGVPIRKVRRA